MLRSSIENIIVVSDGSSRIGKACIDRFKSIGATRAINFDLAAPAPDRARDYISVDVTDEAPVAKGVTEVVEKYGRIDGLVNCAGRRGGGHAHQL